jgi:hypothetical protein
MNLKATATKRHTVSEQIANTSNTSSCSHNIYVSYKKQEG